MYYPMYVSRNYSGHLVGQENLQLPCLFYGEKAGPDFFGRRPCSTHCPSRAPPQPCGLLGPMPSISAGCCTQHQAAASWSWLFYITLGYRRVWELHRRRPAVRRLFPAASGVADRGGWCMPQTKGPATNLPILFSVEKTTETHIPEKMTQRPPKPGKGAVLCVFRKPYPPGDLR